MSVIKNKSVMAPQANEAFYSPAGLSVSKDTVPPAAPALGSPPPPVPPVIIPRRASFRELYCEKFPCLPERFAEDVLWRCVYPRAKMLARLLWRIDRGYFAPDFHLLEEVAEMTDNESMVSEINDARYRFKPRGLLRGKLRVRLSSQKLRDLANELFKSAK